MNGELAYSKRRGWIIRRPKPHIAMMLKRMFDRIHKADTDPLVFGDSRNAAADLLWFMERYPLAVSDKDRRRLEGDKAAWVDQALAVERILHEGWKPSGGAGFKPGRAPYPYQAQAAGLTLTTGRLLLMDEVGLGKTFSAMTALASGAPLPAAVVVEAHLTEQWAEDFIHPNTNLRAHIVRKGRPYDLPDADIYIFKYSSLIGWIDFFATEFFRSVVFDEIQSLRHGRETRKGQASWTLAKNADLRMGLTATPIYNYGDEIYNVVQYIDPDVFGSKDEFYREWTNRDRVVKNPDALGAHLVAEGVTLRRTEADVSSQLPPLNSIDVEIPFDEQVFEDSEAAARDLAGRVMTGAFVKRGQAARELDIMMRMATGVAKAHTAAAYVRMLLQEARKVLLVGWHRDVYDIWLEQLAEFSPALYTGTETPAGKRRNKAEFVEGDARVLILSLRSGAGLDGLQTVCEDVVFGELDWSPQVHHQVIGRLRRPGQGGRVTAHYLHCDGGSDPLLIEALGLKADQSRRIVDPGSEPVERQSDDSRIRRLAERILAA